MEQLINTMASHDGRMSFTFSPSRSTQYSSSGDCRDAGAFFGQCAGQKQRGAAKRECIGEVIQPVANTRKTVDQQRDINHQNNCESDDAERSGVIAGVCKARESRFFKMKNDAGH
jgi:hypothetical protein